MGCGILSLAQYIAFEIVSGKKPFSPKRTSMAGSKPSPSRPICERSDHMH